MLDLKHLAELAARYPEAARATVQEFSLAGRRFSFNSRPELMGVINLSPDSWYRESVCLSAESALQRGRVLHAQGAALVDVGAESTLERASRADTEAQLSKLLPIIKGLRRDGIAVSVETYLPEVARASLEAGATVLNLTGTILDDDLLKLAAEREAGLILCYIQGEHVRAVSDFQFYQDPIEPMLEFFKRQIERAVRQGVQRIFVDPGLGFYYRNLQDSAVRIRHQMNVFLNTFRLRALGWPVCHALPHAFEYFRDEVRCGEPFFAVLAAIGRTDLFRTHEVPRTRAVLETLALV